MKIGIPIEIKPQEARVAMAPAGVRALIKNGHQVFVQQGAGSKSGITDAAYVAAGASLINSADELWQISDMIIKVKEPIAEEYPRLRQGQLLFTYLHLAAAPELTKVLLDKQITGVAYETIQTSDGRLPLLQPMSEVAGKMSVQVGARLLEKEQGGKGILLSGIPGVRKGRVVIIGGGVVGTAAAKIALGMGADVTLLDISIARLGYLDDIFGARIHLLHSNIDNIATAVKSADLLIGGVLVPGARAPTLVPRTLISEMEEGSVVIDVAIDQGGCIETIRPTTHASPTYIVDGVVHYGVTNMPGAVAQTSTLALTNVTLEYAVKLANLGVQDAAQKDPALAKGVNTMGGFITHQAVADALKLPFRSL
jgi:alanine dehydrogenase